LPIYVEVQPKVFQREMRGEYTRRWGRRRRREIGKETERQRHKEERDLDRRREGKWERE
jgi:hypothetical protein